MLVSTVESGSRKDYSNGNMNGNHALNGDCKGGAELIRKDLAGYGKASNLKMNEHIKELISQGHQIYHLAFGQSPFPIPAKLEAALVKNAYRNEYVNMIGELSTYNITDACTVGCYTSVIEKTWLY